MNNSPCWMPRRCPMARKPRTVGRPVRQGHGWIVPSLTSPGTTYTVSKDYAGRWQCTCLQHYHRVSSGKAGQPCKHVAAVIEAARKAIEEYREPEHPCGCTRQRKVTRL